MDEKWWTGNGLEFEIHSENKFKFVRVDYIKLFWRYVENVVFDYNV